MLTAHSKEARPRRASISSNLSSGVTLWALPGVPWVPPAAGSRASCVPPRLASAAPPAIASAAPRTSWDRWVDRHRPWKIRERNHETDGLTGAIDPLNDEPLPFFQLADEFAARFVVGHATVVEADDVRPGHGLAAVDDHPSAGLDRHTQRQGDSEHLFRLVFRFDQHGRDHRHTRFDAAVLAGEADLLGIRLLAFQAELGPRRKDELRLLGLCLRLLRMRDGS